MPKPPKSVSDKLKTVDDGRWLKQVLDSKQINGKVFARLVSWNEAKVSRTLNGLREITLSDIREICTALDMKESDFILGINDTEPKDDSGITDNDRFIRKCTNVIYASLIEKDILFKRIKDQKLDCPITNMGIELVGNPISKWYFLFLCIKPGVPMTYIIQNTFGQILTTDFGDKCKISILTDNESALQYLEGHEHALKYNGDLSVIRINADTETIERETYLSNYNNNKKNEFCLP